MSKKKNTLKDLDEFLKQQAATLVTPERLTDKAEPAIQKPTTQAPPPPPAVEHAAPVQETKKEPPIQKNDQTISAEKLLNDLKALASREGNGFRNQFYDLIIKSVESQNQYSVEDKMLINTALYLKNGERWKEAIREYWRKKVL